MTLQKINAKTAGEEYYIGVSWDYCYIIRSGDRDIGKVYLSEMLDGSVYIEWLELKEEERGKGHLRKVIDCLRKEFPDREYIEAEASVDVFPLYEHIGFEETGFDMDREMHEIRLRIKQ